MVRQRGCARVAQRLTRARARSVLTGHSYERAELQRLLDMHGAQACSPLTRETLRTDVVIPNVALRKRIQSHAEDELRVAEAARAAAAAIAREEGRAEGRAEGAAEERKRQAEASSLLLLSTAGNEEEGQEPKRARRS